MPKLFKSEFLLQLKEPKSSGFDCVEIFLSAIQTSARVIPGIVVGNDPLENASVGDSLVSLLIKLLVWILQHTLCRTSSIINFPILTKVVSLSS